MAMHSSRFFLPRLMAVLFLLGWGTMGFNHSYAQAPKNTVVIEGDDLQNCIVSLRYFRARQLAKTVVSRVTLINGSAEEPIEPQFDGIEVIVQSTFSPLMVSIRSDGKVLENGQLDRTGVAKLTLGKVGRAPFEPVAIQLSASEAALVTALVKAMSNQRSISSLVSDSPAANIDGPCVDVFLRELRTLIGAPVDVDSASDGWLGWSDQLGNRTLAGVIRCESGSCGLRVSLEKNRIRDMVPNSPFLPDTYFREPVNVQGYIRQAKLLTRSVFDGNARKAHEFYSPKFQEQVSVDQLSQLSELVQERYGKTIRSIDFKRSSLQDYNYQLKSNLLNIDLILETETEARCISRVVFSIPTGRNQIGKAHLGAINILHVFQSSHPKLAKATERLATELSKGLSAQQLIGIYPEKLTAIAQQDELQALLTRLADYLKGNEPAIDFDLWTVSSFEELVQASGPVQFGDKDCFLEVQYVGDQQLLGFSIYGPSLSESTLGLFDFDAKVVGIAKEFWKQLLTEDAERAYSLLDAEFQQQFSLEELKEQLQSPQNENSPLIDVVEDHVRIANSSARPEPLMVSVYLTASFEDGAPLALTCDLPVEVSTEDQLGIIFDFSNDFDMNFPVESIPVKSAAPEGSAALIGAFVNSSVDEMLALIDPSQQPSIDRATLTAYLKKLKELAGQLDRPQSVSRTVEYDGGVKRYRCNANLVNNQGAQFPLEGWFRDGYLERFAISDVNMIDFVSLINDSTEIERRVQDFVKSWLNDQADIQTYLLPAISTESTMVALSALREQFHLENGKLSSAKITKKHPYERGGILQFDVTLTGVAGTKVVKISVDVGAFGGHISGITF